MKPRLGDAVGFAIGAIGAFVMVHPWPGIPPVLWMGLLFLCPGIFLAFFVIALAPSPGLSGLTWVFWLGPVLNGLVFATSWRLTRSAVQGRRLTVLALVIGLASWITWFAVWSVQNWPTPEPPIAPVDLASPLAGRWQGVLHTSQDDRPVFMICHPRTDGTLDGFLSINGGEIEVFDEGTCTGDSLYFSIIGYHYSGHRDSTRLSMRIEIYGVSQPMDLTFVSADTSVGPLPPGVERRR
jgi:hypothetical protein